MVAVRHLDFFKIIAFVICPMLTLFLRYITKMKEIGYSAAEFLPKIYFQYGGCQIFFNF